MKKKNELRILFAISAINVFTHYKSIVENLSKRGHKTLILFDSGWSKELNIVSFNQSSKGIKNMSQDWLLRRDDVWRNLLFFSRELLSYRRYLLFNQQSYYYLNRAKKYLPSAVRIAVRIPFVDNIIKTRFTEIILRLIEQSAPVCQKIKHNIEKFNPDVVIAGPCSMRFSEELAYIKAAKKMGIPTIIPISSWDNLTFPIKSLSGIKPNPKRQK